VLFAQLLPANAEQMRFRKISLEQGLSQSSVYAILQDKQGFLWFGTQDGLNRFDGYTLTVFRQQNNNPRSLPNNCIQTLFEDRSGTLWVGTRGGGAVRRNPYTGIFSPAYTPHNNTLGIEEQDVYAFAEDKLSQMWIGTAAGLICVKTSNGAIVEQFSPKNSPLRQTMIRALVVDSTGVLWIATPEGLYAYTPASKQWRTFQQNSSLNSSNDIRALVLPTRASGVASNELIVATASALVRLNTVSGNVISTLPHNTRTKASVNTLFAVKNGGFWVGYGGDGVHECSAVYGEKQELTERRALRHSTVQPNSLSNDAVLSVYFDRTGGLWIGTDGAGVNYAHPDEYRFENFTNDASGSGGNIVLALTEETRNPATRGHIWLGTLSTGIARFNPTEHSFTTFRNIPNNPRSLLNNLVWSMLQDRLGTLWVGTSGGLSRFNEASGDFTNYTHNAENPVSLPDNSIYSMLEDSHGNFWLATNNGLARMNRETGVFTSFRSNGTASSISSNSVRKIYEDRSGTLWIGTRGGGLNRFDPHNGSFLHFRHNPSNPTSISNDYVLSIHEDRSGMLWIGTAGGLNKFDRASGTFTAFREGDGLVNNYICGILEDESGNLWLGTVRGICKFDPRTGKFATFEELYNRAGSEFNQDACLKASNGMLYFGGISGFVRFHPDSIHTNFSVPPVVVTGFKKFNKPVDMTLLGDSLIPTKRELHLSVDDTFISFEFAALSYTLPHKISYSCKLEGFDNEWIDLGNKREATYTNLDAGEYVFRVRASNYDGVWNEEGTRLTVIIHPHWWQTWWAKSLAVFLIALMALIGYKWRVRRIEERSHVLEQTVNERTAALSMSNREITRQNDSLMQLNQEKNEFLGIAAHDLKNPLTAIMMSSSIVKQYHNKMTADEVIEQMEHILITAKRMKETILNLLDINSIESGKFKFSNIPMNVVEVVNDVVEGYYLRAKDKEISLHLNTETDEVMTFTDRNAFMQIMENLISNSIKYSPLGKNVYVNIITSQTDQMQALFTREEEALEHTPLQQAHVRIEIQDEGPGLTPEDKQKLFGKFAKLSAKPTGGEHSTGLGLSIVKKIVEAMHGQVWCESELGAGATFIVELPLVEIPPEALMQD
jgi:ligand-binding sensor domain-containing protein/signal transduction histidine kinase